MPDDLDHASVAVEIAGKALGAQEAGFGIGQIGRQAFGIDGIIDRKGEGDELVVHRVRLEAGWSFALVLHAGAQDEC